MGLLDSLAGQALQSLGGQAGGAGSNGAGGLLQVVLGLLNNPQVGGLAGLVAAFQQKGLGDVAASWVGTGANLPVSGTQLHDVLGSLLGPEQLGAIASQLGLSSGREAAGALSGVLPQVVDHLTPQGQLPAGGLPQGDLMGSLGGLLQALSGPR